MIITDPDPYLLPTYRLSPFVTRDVHSNARLANDGHLADTYFAQRFAQRHFVYTPNGRTALNIALSYYHLGAEDVVTILTTSGNRYISSCVTREIEKFCRWSMKIEPNTKVVLVNHEFGYPYSDLAGVASLGYPIIEDCAYSFASEDSRQAIGRAGDFALYSLPKYFPVQVGGVLTAREGIPLPTVAMADGLLRYIKKTLTRYLPELDKVKKQRLANYRWLLGRLSPLGCAARLSLAEGTVPGVFLFTVPEGADPVKMKSFLQGRGIQCSVFYGEQAFYVPVHQRLQEEDLQYIAENMKESIRKTDD